jgi:methylated-DNA-[protein]-cysteine S-methyltransferase
MTQATRYQLHLTELPIGTLTLTARDDALTGVRFGRLDTPGHDPLPNDLLLEAAHQLSEYFAGKRRAFDLPLAPEGTAFQRRVWAGLCEIPFGETRSYGALAAAIGNPRAARAVGMANNRNPISIIIPCHRVIGADGTLVGYGGGLTIKETLLRLEGILD